MENNINSLFATFTQAKELKELGMDEPCFAYYHDGRITGVDRWDRKEWEFHILINKEVTAITNEVILAPLKQQVLQFALSKYNLLYKIEWTGKFTNTFKCSIINMTDCSETIIRNKEEQLYFKTYEQVESECIDKLISLIKNK